MSLTTGIMLLPLFDPLSRVSSSANGIYSLMNNINSFTSCPCVIASLKELDIEASVRVLEKLIKELNVTHQTKTLTESINLLKECIVNIENELSVIHEYISYNSTIKYFGWFRKYTFTEQISKLNILKKQLDNRTNIFFNIIQTNNNLIIKNKNLPLDTSLFGDSI